jgi:hypothetical protein
MKLKLAALAAAALFATAASAQPQAVPDARPKGGPARHARGDHGPREMTKDEFLARAAQHFDEMDANHDGKLDRDEMRAFREKMREQRGKGPQGGPPLGVEGGPGSF